MEIYRVGNHQVHFSQERNPAENPNPHARLGNLSTGVGLAGVFTEVLMHQNLGEIPNAVLATLILFGVFYGNLPNFKSE